MVTSGQSHGQTAVSQSLATMPVPMVMSDKLHSQSISSQIDVTTPVPTLDVSVLRNCSLVIPIDNDDAIYEVLPQATTACPVVHNAIPQGMLTMTLDLMAVLSLLYDKL